MSTMKGFKNKNTISIVRRGSDGRVGRGEIRNMRTGEKK